MIYFDPNSHTLDVKIESGALEGAMLQRFAEATARIPAGEIRKVHVDLGAVDQMDSNGLDALLSFRKKVETVQDFALENVSPNVQKVIALLGAGPFLGIQSAT